MTKILQFRSPHIEHLAKTNAIRKIYPSKKKKKIMMIIIIITTIAPGVLCNTKRHFYYFSLEPLSVFRQWRCGYRIRVHSIWSAKSSSQIFRGERKLSSKQLPFELCRLQPVAARREDEWCVYLGDRVHRQRLYRARSRDLRVHQDVPDSQIPKDHWARGSYDYYCVDSIASHFLGPGSDCERPVGRVWDGRIPDSCRSIVPEKNIDEN